jgi:hypothetical protein
MPVGKARSLPKRGAPERSFHLGMLLPYPTNTLLALKDLPGANTLA